MFKVLIITYYWPPSGGSAVLRWLKFTKYLREFGWEPVIYTALNPEPQEIDESLLKDIPDKLEVLKTKIVEPYSIYKWLTGKKKKDRLGVALMSDKKTPNLITRLSLWIRSNLFIPDPRMLWINPSIKYLCNYLKHNSADVIITSGPPHSMHLIGLGLKRKLGIKWVADFRDPWTNIDFYHELLLTRFADKHHRKLERRVLENADHVVTVSDGMTNDFIKTGITNITTITNGYDEEPFATEYPAIGKFTITHLGSLPKSRNPENLWNVIAELVKQNKQLASALEIRLVGKSDQLVQDSIASCQLQDYVVHKDFIPHQQTFDLLRGSTVLLLCINNTPNAKSILTNKFFEYLSAKKPIIAIGPPDGDAAVILKETGAGKIFNYDDATGLKHYLLSLFDLYSQGKLYIDSSGIDKYSRRNLTRQLSELLNSMSN